MAGFTSQTAQFLSLCLYVHIALLCLNLRAANELTALAVALGLCAVHGAMIELLQTFVALSGGILVIDVITMFVGGLGTWLRFLLVLAMVARGGAMWFGWRLAQEEREGEMMYQPGATEVYVSPGEQEGGI